MTAYCTGSAGTLSVRSTRRWISASCQLRIVQVQTILCRCCANCFNRVAVAVVGIVAASVVYVFLLLQLL